MIQGESTVAFKVYLEQCVYSNIGSLCHGNMGVDIQFQDPDLLFVVSRTTPSKTFVGNLRVYQAEGVIAKCETQCAGRVVEILNYGMLMDYLVLCLAPNLLVIRQIVYTNAVLAPITPDLLQVRMDGQCVINDHLFVRLDASDNLVFTLYGCTSHLVLDCAKPEAVPLNFDFMHNAFMYSENDMLPEFVHHSEVARGVRCILGLLNLDPIKEMLDADILRQINEQAAHKKQLHADILSQYNTDRRELSATIPMHLDSPAGHQKTC